MKSLSTYFQIVACVTVLLLCQVAFAATYFAFSLREASNRAQAGQKSKELLTLAGITRIVGMVHDQKKDVILIGKNLSDLPGASFDDFVVALRARLVHDQWPEVSIDPAEDSPKTGLQKVSFRGGIMGTRFGLDFLNCDIFLKKYSLEIIPPIGRIHSYKLLSARNIKTSLEAKGVRVGQIRWLGDGDSVMVVEDLHGRGIESEESSQIRFWFAPMEPYQFVAREGVFCIKELRLGVQQERITASTTIQQNNNSLGLEKAGSLFAKQFTEHFYEMANSQPLLKRLKILYDLVAVAEGIRGIENRPDLSYLLKKYPVSSAKTAQNYRFIQIFGFVERADKQQHIIRISGGIKFKTELKWLNYGDVTPLKKIVLQTRPSPSALSWRLPLNSWQMPNSQDRKKISEPKRESQRVQREDSGTIVSTQSFVLGPLEDSQSDSSRKFWGFPPPPPPPPLPVFVPTIEYLSGVSIDIEVQEESFKKDKSGDIKKLRDDILKSRPKSDSLNWDIEEKKHSR